jgi:pilus assembly protein CpaE
VAASDLGREGRDDGYERILADFDKATLDQVLEHYKFGLRVLPAPPRPEMAERIPPAILRHAIRLCSEEYEYTIVDMCSSYTESDMQLLDMATRIVVVLKPEMSSIRNTTVFMDYARQFGWKRKLVMVLNRADSNRFTRISQAAVEQHLGCPVIPIPSSGLVPQAASESRTLWEVFPTSKVADALRILLDTIDGPSEEALVAKNGFAKNIIGRLGPKRVASVTS